MRKIIILALGLSLTLFADFSRSADVVTDNSTGLLWADDSNASTLNLAWTAAIDHCETSTLGGYSDWRLPNFNELYFITDYSNHPAIDSIFENIVPNSYWSSTTYVGVKNNAWIIYFGNNGYGTWDVKSNSHYVRCVRGGK